jgi:hypothetical protein
MLRGRVSTRIVTSSQTRIEIALSGGSRRFDPAPPCIRTWLRSIFLRCFCFLLSKNPSGPCLVPEPKPQGERVAASADRTKTRASVKWIRTATQGRGAWRPELAIVRRKNGLGSIVRADLPFLEHGMSLLASWQLALRCSSNSELADAGRLDRSGRHQSCCQAEFTRQGNGGSQWAGR